MWPCFFVFLNARQCFARFVRLAFLFALLHFLIRNFIAVCDPFRFTRAYSCSNISYTFLAKVLLILSMCGRQLLNIAKPKKYSRTIMARTPLEP